MDNLVHLPAAQRNFVIGAALLALFLGALDALIMSAAMPSIVSEVGGLDLYAWVYSAYFLARAVALPIFGKLADLYDIKKLFLFSIALFLIASLAAGMAGSMGFLVLCRVFQGIGAGGNFALVYIVLSHLSAPGQRGRTLSLASSVWGIASVIGPTLGGFIVSYFSWRWIFFINIPLGVLCLVGIGRYLEHAPLSTRRTRSLDLAGLGLFSGFILGLLIIFIVGGREIGWLSGGMALLVAATVILGSCFYRVEQRAENPLVDLRFFRSRCFALSNAAVFFASFTIFSLFAYAPLFIQGGLGLSPMQVGLAMVALSLGWSFGSLFLGRCLGGGGRSGAMAGGVFLVAGSALMLGFDLQTSISQCFLIFLLIGAGMGFVTLSTLILVQNSSGPEDLGIVTSLHQFGRSLGGTIGVGVSGGLVTSGLLASLDKAGSLLSPELVLQLQESTENLLRPEFQALVSTQAREALRGAVVSASYRVFLVAVAASFLCLLCCLLIDKEKGARVQAPTMVGQERLE